MSPVAARRIETVRATPVRIVAGLMSGTSMDGIDVAVCRVAAGEPRLLELLGARTVPWDEGLAARLLRAHAADALELSRLNRLTGEAFADAAADLAEALAVTLDLVGSHGQTVAHEHGVATLQIGEAAFLAERLGCPVVSDFRQNDIAAGGCGAPLVPIVDRWLLSRPNTGVMALNLGGISNLTALPAARRSTAAVLGFDCGPGNMALDELARRHSGGAASCDRDGGLAAAGDVDPRLLAVCWRSRRLAMPPRSFGREQYGAAFVDGLLERHRRRRAGLAEPVRDHDRAHGQVVAGVYRRYVVPVPRSARCRSGGGARNGELMRRLGAGIGAAAGRDQRSLRLAGRL